MSIKKEAKARIKINKLLEKAGWRFFDEKSGKANIQLEPNIKISRQDLDSQGNDFEKTKKGFVDYLLLDKNDYPLVVLEAKREEKNPLDGKEQARKYAHNLNVRFVVLSNGNLHYFWDLEIGNPEIITEFPTQDSLRSRHQFQPNNTKLYEDLINEDYIAHSQKPDVLQAPDWQKNKAILAEKWGIRFYALIRLKLFRLYNNRLKTEIKDFYLKWQQAQGKPCFHPL